MMKVTHLIIQLFVDHLFSLRDIPQRAISLIDRSLYEGIAIATMCRHDRPADMRKGGFIIGITSWAYFQRVFDIMKHH
jgi:hypothetical protein